MNVSYHSKHNTVHGSILRRVLAFDTIYYHDTQFLFFHLLACVNSIGLDSIQFNSSGKGNGNDEGNGVKGNIVFMFYPILLIFGLWLLRLLVCPIGVEPQTSLGFDPDTLVTFPVSVLIVPRTASIIVG